MKLDIALAVILAINMFFFLGQTAITEINPEGQTFFNYEDSMLGDFDMGNYTLDEDVSGKFPQSESNVNPTTGNIFTDPFGTIKTWLFDNTAVKYLTGIVNAVPNFLKSLGLPPQIVWVLGAFWHGLTLFILIGWSLGRTSN